MKALTLASIFALGIAGSACSQTVEASEDEPKAEIETVETPEAAPEVAGTFNLGLPTEAPVTAGTSAGGFNLGAAPAPGATSTNGFNLAADVGASNGLAALPELEGTVVGAPETAIDAEALPDDIIDDEPVIRLDE